MSLEDLNSGRFQRVLATLSLLTFVFASLRTNNTRLGHSGFVVYEYVLNLWLFSLCLYNVNSSECACFNFEIKQFIYI